jgi:hypothetical protein
VIHDGHWLICDMSVGDQSGGGTSAGAVYDAVSNNLLLLRADLLGVGLVEDRA